MDTKLKADIAESAVVTRLLKEGFRVLKPIGDRLPYDLAVDVDGKLLKIQIKSAWRRNGNYLVDSRRTKTNRRRMVRSRYDHSDFDFAILYLDDLDVFYVMPFEVFSSYKSEICLTEAETRQRKPKSYQYREAWALLKKWAVQPVTVERNLSNSVNPEMGIPSQVCRRQSADVLVAERRQEGVETRRQASIVRMDEGIVRTTNPPVF